MTSVPPPSTITPAPSAVAPSQKPPSTEAAPASRNWLTQTPAMPIRVVLLVAGLFLLFRALGVL